MFPQQAFPLVRLPRVERIQLAGRHMRQLDTCLLQFSASAPNPTCRKRRSANTVEMWERRSSIIENVC